MGGVHAVVVTHNRRELLLACLRALARQSRAVDGVTVVDNASTDGTREALSASGLGEQLTLGYLRLARNGGGAEGFHYGVSAALPDELDARPVSQQWMDTVPDTRLLERARAGDEVAFQALVEPHRRPLQLHCYRMVGSVQDSEDLVQETLLAAWRGLHDFNGGAKLRTWLYRIATNTCLNALRSRSRRRNGSNER